MQCFRLAALALVTLGTLVLVNTSVRAEISIVPYLDDGYIFKTVPHGTGDGFQEPAEPLHPWINVPVSDDAVGAHADATLTVTLPDGDGWPAYLILEAPPDDDFDGDGLSDKDELFDVGTDPQNSDTDGDGYPDGDDGCPLVPTAWFTPVGDSDCDSFADSDEGIIGTDPSDPCANTPAPDDEADDRWPSDFDDNQVINVLDIGAVMPPWFGSSVPPTGARRDIVPDGFINILDVGMTMPPYFGYSCISSVWQPEIGTTWQWQLSSVPDQDDIDDYPAEMYDIDGFDTDSDDVDLIHENEAMAVCYLSAGTAEDWRPDFDDLHPNYTGNESGEWGGEWFIDYTNPEVLDVMETRIEMCAEKGFDAVEWDNVDIYDYPTSTTGLSLSYSDQLEYNTWLANQTHARGMSVALKNDADQVDDLVNLFDFAIVEECHEYGECGSYSPFIESDKAVFACEYESFNCEDVDQWDFVFIRKHKSLDAWRVACW